MNDLIKCLTCAIIGVALGIEMKSTDDWWIQAIAIAVSLVILILLSVLFKTDKKEKKTNNVEQKKQTITTTATGEGARITRAEPKTAIETGKKPVRELVLINEEGDVLFTWDIRGKTSLVIGKSTQKEPVDIDLSMSAMSQMISKQHAVLNYTNDGWCIDDIDSKNGIINIDKSYQRIKAKDTIGPPKTENSFRKVDIPQFLCDQLEEYLKKHYILNEDDRIFKEYYVIIRDRLKKAQKRANLNEEFTLHSFRHSHVSLLIDLGYSPTIVADRIGDTVDTVLKTYSHLYAESKESLSEKLNNLYK